MSKNFPVDNKDDEIVLSFRIPKKLAIRLRIAASKENVSRSELLRRILANELYFLEKDKK